jgi:hypothetical protein
VDLCLFPFLTSAPSLEREVGGWRGTIGYGGIVIIACVVRVFSGHDMVVTGAGEAPMPCPQGEGRLSPPSLSEVMWSSLVESTIMGHSEDGGP